MHHLVTHKLREKAAGRDPDAIVVIDPHTDLVEGILEHVPEEIAGQVRLIDWPTTPGRRASTCWTPASSPTGTGPPTRWCASRRACGSNGGRGCSPSWSRPSRPSTRPTSTPRPTPTSSTPSWTGCGCCPTTPTATPSWRRSPTPTCLSGGPGTSAAGTASTAPRPSPPSRRASPTTHPPSGQGRSSASAAPPSTCAAPSSTAASCLYRHHRAPSAGTWPPWWARRCSIWWTP